MINLIKNNKIIFLLHLLLILIASIILFSYQKAAIHIYINSHHFELGNYFFKYYTYIGDGLFVALAGILSAFFWSYRRSLQIIVSFAISGITVQVLKRFVFEDYYRPLQYFRDLKLDNFELHLIEGIKVYTWGSFPSGHTTAAFALFLTLILSTKSKYTQGVYLLLAYLAGFSRMYISQHFLMDVLGGIILATIITIPIFEIFNKSSKPWMDKKIMNLG